MTTPVRVPLVDLRASYASIREELLAEFDRVLGEMQLFLGPNVRAFEEEFAAYCETSHAVGMSSGTDALHATLRACDVRPGDEVVLPALTFFATTEAVIHVGATPVFADVDPETLTLDPAAVRDVIGPATRAIVPVHLYGQPADMASLLEIAKKRNLRVIEDAAQAHGARSLGQRCGSLGDAGCFSFYFTKNLGAFGEGGCTTTNSLETAERLQRLRNHGLETKHTHSLVGHNFRLDELQAAVLRIKLKRLDEAIARRREIAARYDKAFAGSGIRVLGRRADAEAAPHLYPIRVADRDALEAHLAAAGIETGIHYKVPAHRQAAMRSQLHRCGPLSVTERTCDELLSLPLYPELEDDQFAYVVERVLEFSGESRPSARVRSAS